MSSLQVPVSVIIPTWQRPDALAVTLRRIACAEPMPAEVLVHVDAGDDVTEPMLAEFFPWVRVIRANAPAGPGGGRNALMELASAPVVASFDDDSFPIDNDFFADAERLMAEQPQAAVLAGMIVHDGEAMPDRSDSLRAVADFVGCGAVLRRVAFLETEGYLPLPLAYGAEEADLTLQLHEHGWAVIQSGKLRVRHATGLAHHESPAVTAASVTNLALLAFLRYPAVLWPLGVAQVARRVSWLLRHGRWKGISAGVVAIPAVLRANRYARRPVAATTVQRVRELRKTAEPL